MVKGAPPPSLGYREESARKKSFLSSQNSAEVQQLTVEVYHFLHLFKLQRISAQESRQIIKQSLPTSTEASNEYHKNIRSEARGNRTRLN